MKKQLQKAIDLAAYTGDKIIVVDDKNDQGTVIIPLDEYERMVFGQDDGSDWNEELEENLTGEEMLDKINREITLEKGSESSDEVDGLKEMRNEDDFLTFGSDSEVESDLHQELPPNLPVDEESDLNDIDDEDLNDPEKEENIYYYEEAPAVVTVAEEKTDESAAENNEEEKEDFTSVGEELKNRHNWDIPKDVKSGAQEVK
jgi:hypothetical protein